MVDGALLTDMIDGLYASDDLGDTFSRITGTAVQVLDACDFASVTTIGGRELTTQAPTDEAALTADLLQYEEGEGPCLDAVTRERWVLTPDVLADRRWPRSAILRRQPPSPSPGDTRRLTAHPYPPDVRRASASECPETTGHRRSGCRSLPGKGPPRESYCA